MPRPLRVLVVDDHPDSAEATAQLLTLHGHETCPVHSYAEALAQASGFAPDVVITDVRLPDGDGYALAAEVCQLLTRRPALVALTGLSGQEARCQAEGFDRCILKPADPVELANLLVGYAARLAD
jgi:CheY-like chemotaxis protein